jgi:putative lipoprotein
MHRRGLLLLAALPAVPAAATMPPDPGTLVGPVWRAEEIAGRGVLDRVRPDLGFTADGRARGQTGCNGFSGPYVADGASLRIGPVAATMVGCFGAIGEQEGRFLAALREVRGWRLETGRLHLTNAGGATLIRLAR